jgi:hypothetical protein
VNNSDADILKRVPPQNLDAEQSVLGAILLDNNTMTRAVEIVSPEDFYRETHREIFRAMVDLTKHNKPVDAIMLSELLRTKGALEAIGGSGYIAELAAFVPTAENVVHYAPPYARRRCCVRSDRSRPKSHRARMTRRQTFPASWPMRNRALRPSRGSTLVPLNHRYPTPCETF